MSSSETNESASLASSDTTLAASSPPSLFLCRRGLPLRFERPERLLRRLLPEREERDEPPKLLPASDSSRIMRRSGSIPTAFRPSRLDAQLLPPKPACELPT